jgi:Tetratricopeptide repeat
MTWTASRLIEAGDFSAAEQAYRTILRSFPDDSLAKVMMAECLVGPTVNTSHSIPEAAD